MSQESPIARFWREKAEEEQAAKRAAAKPPSAASEPTWGELASAVVPQPVKTSVGLVMDLLTRPSAALAGAALAQREGRDRSDAFWQGLKGERKTSFMDVAARDFGKDSKVGKALGFAADIVADPLNLITGGTTGVIRKGAQAAAKGAASVAPEVVTNVARAVKDDLGQRFITHYGTSLRPEDVEALARAGKAPARADDFRDSLRLFERERSTLPARVEARVIDRYRGTTPEERGAVSGVMEALEAGAGKTDRVDELMLTQRKVNDDLFAREVKAGVQTPDAYKPDYAVHDYSRSKNPTGRALNNPHAAINAKNQFSKGRKDAERTIQEAVALGAEPDAALAHLTRELAGETSVATAEFVKSAGKRFGLPVDKAPGDWQTLKNLPMEKPLKEEMSEIAFPAYVARELDRFYAPKGKPSQLGRMYDHALRIWKTQATVLRPGHHVLNATGNLFNGAFLAGALHPARWIESAQWPWLKARGFPNAPRIGRYTPQEVDEFMQKFGVGGAARGFTNELLEEGADKVLLEKLAEPASSTLAQTIRRKAIKAVKHPIRAASHASQASEDFAKRALFFDRLHKGDSLEDAAKTVDRYLFDYGSLTEFERNVAKRIMPFWTWASKNTSLQIQELLNQPGKYAAVSKTANAIERSSEEDNTAVPDARRVEYLQRAGAIQVPSDEKGNRRFWVPNLPYADLNKVPVPGGSTPIDVVRDLGSALSPAIKTPIELVTNRNLFFDRPIYDADLGPMADTQRIPASLDFLPESLKRKLFAETATPRGPEFQTPAAVRYGIEQFSPFSEAVGRAARSATDTDASANPYQPLGLLAGVRIVQRTPQQVRLDNKAAIERERRTRTKARKQAVTKTRLEEIKRMLNERD